MQLLNTEIYLKQLTQKIKNDLNSIKLDSIQLSLFLQHMSEYELGNIPYLESYSEFDILLGFINHQDLFKSSKNPDIVSTINQTITDCKNQSMSLKINCNQPQQTKNTREKTKIECSRQKIISLKHYYRGSKDETCQLNTNFKTIIYNFLKQLVCLREVNDNDLESIKKFKRTVPSFESFGQLFNSANCSQQLKQKCKQFICSTRIIKQIMLSRIKHQRKLTMLKYVQILRYNLQNEAENYIRWKILNKHKIESI